LKIDGNGYIEFNEAGYDGRPYVGYDIDVAVRARP